MRKKREFLKKRYWCLFVIGCCLPSLTIQAKQVNSISLNKPQSTIRDVLNEIEQKTQYSFVYNDQVVDADKIVSVKVTDTPVADVLHQVFDDSNVSYTIVDNQIVLTKAAAKEVAQSKKTLKGIVKDVKGEGLTGVSIIVKGEKTGTVSDLDGNFNIDVPENATLVFTYIGYTPQEIKVGSQSNLNVVMTDDNKSLSEVVVIGYGQMRKQDLSTAVGTVSNMEALKERPLTSPSDALQGQIAGVTVTSNGGDPTAGSTIQIRGTGSRGGESPLWVVDGVPGAPVNFNDIESMTVLKDAASAAIYGAYSGSAGVILVTTKQAKAGATTVSYEGVFGVSQATNLPQSLTIDQERQVRQTAYDAAGKTSLPDGWDPVKNPYISTNRTNWIDEIFRPAPLQRHNITLSGGTADFTNRLSLEYSDKQGTLMDTYSKEISMRYTSMFQISKVVRVREDLYWENFDNRGANTDSGYFGVILSALSMPQNAEAYYSDGTYGGTAPKDPAYIAQYGSNFADIHGDVINPLRLLGASNNFRRISDVMSSTFLDIINPIEGLKFTSRFSYKLSNSFVKNFDPMRPEPGKPMLNNTLAYETDRSTNWDFENTLNYNRQFDKHDLGVMLSTTCQEYGRRGFKASATDFENEEAYLQYFTWAKTVQKPDDWFDHDRNLSLVGRLSYSWNDRYFATASYRRDYAGRLPSGHKYGDFPALTAAWKLSSESFMPKVDWLNLLKLRASWGRIGNLGSINNMYGNPTLQNMDITDVGGQVGMNTPIFSNAVYYGKAFNPNLTWETSEQVDFGADFSFFRNRLSVTADYFKKRTYNLIKSQDTGWPIYMGINPMLINQGEIRNQGFELSAGWNDKAGNITYFVNGNFATLRNEVYNIGEADANGHKAPWTDGPDFRGVLKPFQSIEGQPINSYWLIKSDGLFQTDQEAAAYVDKDNKRIQSNAKAGDLKFIDQNGDGKINNDDRIYMGNGMPKLTYALSGGFTWNSLSFSMMLQGVSGVKNFNAQKNMLLNESIGNSNRSDQILDAFPATNRIPRISANDPNNNFGTISDWYLEDAAFLRIKNLTLSYNLDKLINKSALLSKRGSSFSVFGSIDNVYTFTKYTGIDPEIGSRDGIMGFDQGKYPVPRIFSIGLKLKY